MRRDAVSCAVEPHPRHPCRRRRREWTRDGRNFRIFKIQEGGFPPTATSRGRGKPPGIKNNPVFLNLRQLIQGHSGIAVVDIAAVQGISREFKWQYLSVKPRRPVATSVGPTGNWRPPRSPSAPTVVRTKSLTAFAVIAAFTGTSKSASRRNNFGSRLALDD
jgi:hypothetical protein